MASSKAMQVPTCTRTILLDPHDAFVLLEAVRQGLLPRTTRRLTRQERDTLIVDGSVFVWEEEESSMQRWTDGQKWSASRVTGEFLAYDQVLPDRSADPSSRPPDGYLIKQTFASTLPIGNTPKRFHLISYHSSATPISHYIRPSQTRPYSELDLSLWVKHASLWSSGRFQPPSRERQPPNQRLHGRHTAVSDVVSYKNSAETGRTHNIDEAHHEGGVIFDRKPTEGRSASRATSTSANRERSPNTSTGGRDRRARGSPTPSLISNSSGYSTSRSTSPRTAFALGYGETAPGAGSSTSSESRPCWPPTRHTSIIIDPLPPPRPSVHGDSGVNLPGIPTPPFVLHPNLPWAPEPNRFPPRSHQIGRTSIGLCELDQRMLDRLVVKI